MKLISSFVLLFAVMGSALAAAPDPELHAELQKSINPTGITKVDWIKMIPMDASGIVIILPSKFEDFSFYTLNGTTAQGDTEYTATTPSTITEESNPIHFTNTAMSSQPVSFLVECSVPTNAAGEDNWIYVDFETTGTNFTAYGDAKAVFTPRTPELLAMLPTNRAPTTADFPPIPWTDHDSSPEQYTIVLVYCPESSPAGPPPSI